MLAVHVEAGSGFEVGIGVGTAGGAGEIDTGPGLEGKIASGKAVGTSGSGNCGPGCGPTYTAVQPVFWTSLSEVNLMNTAPLVAVYWFTAGIGPVSSASRGALSDVPSYT